MESSEREFKPQAHLDAAARVQAAMSERAMQPRWRWAALGGALGLVHASRALPLEWHGLTLALSCAGIVVMVAVVWRMRSTGVRPRTWGGPWWLVVLLSVAVITAVVMAWPEPTTSGWHPGYLVRGAALAIAYGLGAIVADRMRVGFAARRLA